MASEGSQTVVGREPALPLPPGYLDDDEYVDDLLSFIRDSDLFQWLCGGVHILDFFARSPYLYDWLLEEDWRDWFSAHELVDIIDFILREDLGQFVKDRAGDSKWRGKSPPPQSLVDYLSKIRNLSLTREMTCNVSSGPRANGGSVDTMPRSLAIGMEEKKKHEVHQFTRYVQELSDRVSECTDRPITHFVDFGSGQNYLGRTLASHPNNKHVIAVESKHHNIEGARRMDVSANLAPKTGIRRNKKDFRKEVELRAREEGRDEKEVLNEALREDRARRGKAARAKLEIVGARGTSIESEPEPTSEQSTRAKLERPSEGLGSVQYVEHRLQDGDLRKVIDEILEKFSTIALNDEESVSNNGTTTESPSTPPKTNPKDPSLMVMSIHSCGNLTHHGLRSITLNPTVTAVAMVGCCYNLLTERLPPPVHKLPSLRPRDKTARAEGLDVHGFPMSRHFCEYPTKDGTGVHFNVTARMMAVQAPLNWTEDYSTAFFTRHFFRALLQRIFLDRGIAEAPAPISTNGEASPTQQAPSGHPGQSVLDSQPIIVGSMRKAAYISFTAYVRAAVKKLSVASNHHPSLAATTLPALIAERMADITDEEITAYENEYLPRKKELSTVWTLMAYSAQLVEACVVVDRWLWLREQKDVGPGRCWVENVFDYTQSPRNMVVVGVKKTCVPE